MKLTREGLVNIDLPFKTNTYTPIPNSMLVIKALHEAHANQFLLEKEEYECNSGQSQFKMKMFFKSGLGEDFQLTLLNSYDKAIALRAASGIYSDICWNLNMTGTSTFKRKHTSDADQDAVVFINEAFSDYVNVEQRYSSLKTNLIGQTLSKREMAELAGRFFIEDELINTEQMNMLKKEIQKPSFEYNLNEDSALMYYNHLTHSLKSTSPIHYLNKHEQLLEVMEREFSFTL